jgi:exonuclease SbcC
MIPIRLNLQNFLAYRSPNPIIYDGVHLACLIGENGAGKSSLLDAITWAIWGKARTRRDNDLIHLGASHMYVELDFLHEGQKYRITRSREKRGLGGTSRLRLDIFDADNQLNEISEPSANATQKRINDLLRLDYDTFVNSAFLQQGEADAFTVKQPAKRKEILSNILGLEAWGHYEEQVKEHLTETNSRLNALTLRIEDIDRELETETQVQRDLQEAEEAHQQAKEQLEHAEGLLKEVETAPTERKAAQDQLEAKQARRGEHVRELDEVEKGIVRRAEQIASYEAIIAEAEEITQGYEALQAARTANEDLNQKFKAMTALDKQISELESSLNAEKARLKAERTRLESDIHRLQGLVEDAASDDLDDLMQQVNALEAQSAERDAIQEQIAALGEENAGLKATNASLHTSMNELKERIDALGEVEGAACPLCGQALTDDHRAELLESLQGDGTTQGDTFRANAARMEEIQVELKAAREQQDTLAEAIKDLPRLQKQVGKLQDQAKRAADASIELAETKEQLDAVVTHLADESFGEELRTQIAEISVQREALGYDEEAHGEHEATLDQYRDYDRRHTELEVANQSLTNVQEAQTSAEDRKDRLEKAIAATDSEIIEVEAELERLTVLVETFNERNQEVMRLRTAERQANNRVVSAKQALDSLQAHRERRKTYEERRSIAAEQKAVYEELRTAFGKKGVPAMIIETAIPELEQTTNDLLMRMTDGRMAVKFSTQREKVTGGTAETLDIEIADELGTRSYDLYSGGEAFRINFAIRIALSKMLARRAGAHLETLFIDEGFGTQDADGRSKLVEAINAIKEDFSLILVITHIDELKDAFPVHIHVEKTSNGSLVEIL